jgi:hypothetical protein
MTFQPSLSNGVTLRLIEINGSRLRSFIPLRSLPPAFIFMIYVYLFLCFFLHEFCD